METKEVLQLWKEAINNINFPIMFRGKVYLTKEEFIFCDPVVDHVKCIGCGKLRTISYSGNVKQCSFCEDEEYNYYEQRERNLEIVPIPI